MTLVIHFLCRPRPLLLQLLSENKSCQEVSKTWETTAIPPQDTLTINTTKASVALEFHQHSHGGSFHNVEVYCK